MFFRWLEHIFDSADNNGDGTLDLKEIIKLAKELNMGFSKHDIQGMYKVDFEEMEGASGGRWEGGGKGMGTSAMKQSKL